MIKYIFFLIPTVAFALTVPPAPFPVFLKAGFSSILEFDDTPTRIVLGDGRHFQIEKLDRSIAIKTLAPYATTNMFVYFKTAAPRLFVLTASEDAEPTYYKKFEAPVPPKPPESKKVAHYKRGLRLLYAKFDPKKDFLTVEVEVIADSTAPIMPEWNLIRLNIKKKIIAPEKLWSERGDVQKDSKVRARFIFTKPNIPRDLTGATIIVPIQGNAKALVATIAGGTI